MEVRNSFTVGAPPGVVYDALVDLERVGPAIPGATIGPAGADGAHPARITVKLGPMRMNYAGVARVVERDPEARRAVLEADLKEARGQGASRARMTMVVSDDAGGAGAVVESIADVQLSGRVAQLGRGMIDDVTERLVGQMAVSLDQLLSAAPPPATPAPATRAPDPPAARPVNGLALLLQLVRTRLSRLFKRSR